ncbi:uncharacterized protein LOC111625996 [Centruroides sculpturatus]|uniref:uncharacterized protein LOC111625996 n=1 Tax=Centruroides sculpturatus TaxID=218467 RepID=UPI000C6E153A|nr:uncharacterized protein LOC111625996 [Centruroides sculpturatus]
MADSEKHLDNSSTGVNSLSPESPEGCSLPSTSISLDFDPMSFKFKESSPIASPTDEKVTNGLNSPNNGVQGTPLDLDYFETLNTTNQDRSLIDGPTNQPDIISSSVLKDQDSSIDFQDSGPHSPNNELLLVSASTISSEPNATVSTESVTFSSTEIGTKCTLTSVTNKYSLIDLNEENQEELCNTDMHDNSAQHESSEITKSDDNFYLSSSDALESDYLTQDKTSTSFEDTEENMIRKVKEVKTSFSEKVSSEYHQMNGSLLNSRNAEFTGDEGSLECPVSVAKLRSQYVNHAEQAISQSPPKEIIDTGIDFESLKTSYTQHAQEHRSISPNREAIATGIDINTLKSSLIKPQDVAVSKGQEVIETGISVKSLKSSFNQSQDFQSTPVEEVKLSIDKDQLTRKFSQKSSLIKPQDVAVSKGQEVIETGISVKSLVQIMNLFGNYFCIKIFLLQVSKVDDDLDSPQGVSKKHELIISESTPVELPPDVIRSDTKAADGLEKIPDLSNIRSWFESPQEQQQQHSLSDSTLQRSESILARMAKYQSAVSGEQENGHLSANEDECDDVKIVKSKEKVSFSEMSTLKSQWESGSVTVSKDENVEQKEELSKLRKQFSHGSGKVKTIYEKACQQTSKTSVRTETEIEVGEDISAKLIKEKFEKGVVKNDIEVEKQEKVRKEKEEDLSIFSEGAAHDARNLFKQIDAAGAKVPLPLAKSPNKSPGNEPRRTREIQYFSPTSPVETELIKCSDTSKEVIESIEVSKRFKFFENYKETSSSTRDGDTDKEIPRDPNIIRSSDVVDDIPVTDTTRRMLDKFKALESSVPETITPVAPKPVKRIAPKDFIKVEDNEPVCEQERDPNIIKASYKCDDDIIIEADKAKSLKAKFENWESEVIRENKKNEDEDHLPQADIAKNLRAKFESIKGEPTTTIEKPKSKVNRFIQEQSSASMEVCDICGRRLYPMEKMETSGQKLHKNCFRCAHCSCILRLENYTTSGGKLYCTPHFKQLFISRGNYDEGFGREQHKEKWNRSRSNTPVLRDLSQNGDPSEYTNGETKSILQGTFDQQVVA